MKERERERQKSKQQANPGGFGDERGEPNPGNRNVHGEQEQVDLPEPGEDRKARNKDRGTH